MEVEHYSIPMPAEYMGPKKLKVEYLQIPIIQGFTRML